MKYAGFWRRYIAFIIDLLFAALLSFPIVVAVDSAFKDTIIVEPPFRSLEETIIETKKYPEEYPDGSVTIVEESIVERTYYDKWTYTYRITKRFNQNEVSEKEEVIDKFTHEALDRWDTDDVTFIFLFVYLSLMEGSKYQTSLGKRLFKIKVVGPKGERISISRSFLRNALKILSALTLFIGFMMAGWTLRKQALHDKIAGCELIIPQETSHIFSKD